MSAPVLSRTSPSPPARRVGRRGWRDPRFAVGVGIVAACGLLGARLVGSADDTVPVWALERDLVTGQPLTADDVTVVRVRLPSSADDQYVTASHPLPGGVVLRRDLGAGELVPRQALGAASTAELAALPVSVPVGAVPAGVRAGSTIDVWVTPDESDDSDVAVLVLDDVPVLALPAEEDSLSPAVSRQVIVGLDDDHYELLPTALARLSRGSVVVTSSSPR